MIKGGKINSKLALLFISLFLSCAYLAAQENSVDTLTIQNAEIELRLLKMNDEWMPIRLKNLKTGDAISSNELSPLGKLSAEIKLLSPSTVKRKFVNATYRCAAFNRLTLSVSYDKYEMRQHIDLYTDLPVWVHSIEVMLKEPLSTFSTSAEESNEMIEAAELLTSNSDSYSYFPFAGDQYSVDAVRFQDATDYHSNPVQIDRYLAYKKKAAILGNVFRIYNGEQGAWHFVLKESPISHSQVNWPGYDAAIQPGNFEIYGPGLDENLVGTWQRVYNVAYGAFAKSKNDLDELLLRYKLARYRYIPEYDNTFTLNTWGDRNRDARVSQSFVLTELDVANQLGITHYQIDDGWQAGLSRNSAEAAGENWESWTYEDWQPHPTRFPEGLVAVSNKADSLGMELGLWYNPGDARSYSDTSLHLSIWRKYRDDYGIRLFKIDGVNLGSKSAERDLEDLLKAAQNSHPDIVFNMDVTAGTRGGYHFMDQYGSIFLENRYTDWGNYFPHLSLRNAWLLGHYTPIQRLQLSFLNKWRNTDKYPETGLEPSTYSFDYLFAITMMGQPLAWMEATGLPEEAFEISELIELWKTHRSAWSRVPIIPVGEEPSGYSFCGFAAQCPDGKIYFLLFRENNERSNFIYDWPFPIPAKAKVRVLYESAPSKITLRSSALQLRLNKPKSFVFGYLE